MRLSDFILEHLEAILSDWEAFAALQLPAAAGMSQLLLRDHGEQILRAIAADIRLPQTRQAQQLKSRGGIPSIKGAPETAAQTHALLRARSGFNINQMVAEYRALRATVLRLWATVPIAPDTEPEDMLRFNEAMDQAVSESVAFFSAEVDQARNLFLGMLGHDMRTPLQAIQLTAKYLAQLNAGDDVSVAAGRLINSGARIRALLDDLTDFNRTKFGLGINVTRAAGDLAKIFQSEAVLLRASHPHRRISLEVSGDANGTWDASRLRQVLSNLVVNALLYGTPDTPVRVTLSGHSDAVTLEVRNTATGSDPGIVETMFDPLKRGSHASAQDERGSGLGLGLYIAKEIVTAHGGKIDARWKAGETVVTAQLPKLLASG